MMTLKHFLDRPLWAAAAGYDFNYMDCMSYTANAYDHSFSLLFNSLRILPETEVGELLFMDIGLYRGCRWYCCMAFYFLAGGCCSVGLSARHTGRKLFLR
nr:hypothetical protein [Escherichia coli]